MKKSATKLASSAAIETLKLSSRALNKSQKVLAQVEEAVSGETGNQTIIVPVMRVMESVSRMFMQLQESISNELKEENRDKYK